MVAAETLVQRYLNAACWLQSSDPTLSDISLTISCEQRLARMSWNTVSEVTRTAVLSTPDMASFLGHDWLNDEQMNAGGEWINRQLGAQSPIRVLNTHFLGSLANNRRRSPTWAPSRPRQLDQLIQNGTVSFLIVPVPRPNHWTYLHVHLGDGSCVYVDTLHPDDILAPSEILDVLDWWLETVCPDLGELSEELRTFDVDQQLDSHSCGPATLSTIAHVALGEESWTQDRAPQHRKRWFLRVSDEFATYPAPRPLSDDDSPNPPSEPSAPQFPVFDIDPEELFEDGVDPLLLSTSSRLGESSPSPPPTPIPSQGNTTSAPSSGKPRSHSTPDKLPPQPPAPPVKQWAHPVDHPPLRQGVIPFLQIPRTAWLAQEKLSTQRSAADREEARQKGALEKERLRLASQRRETVRKQDWRKRKRGLEMEAGIRGPDGKKKKISKPVCPGFPCLIEYILTDARRFCWTATLSVTLPSAQALLNYQDPIEASRRYSARRAVAKQAVHSRTQPRTRSV